MAEVKEFVTDIKEKKNLQADVDKEKVPEDYLKQFDKEIETSFQVFLQQTRRELTGNETPDDLQEKFNTWLNQNFEKLDAIKDKAIAEVIIKPTEFELVGFETAKELLDLQDEIESEQRDKTQETVEAEIKGHQLKMKTFNNVKANDIAKLFNENNFKNEDKLLNLLETAKLNKKNYSSDEVKKFQRIIVGIKNPDSNSEDYKFKGKESPLGKFGIDGKFGKETLAAFKAYVENNLEENTKENNQTKTNPTETTPGTTNPGGEVSRETTPEVTNPGKESTRGTTPEVSTENPELRAFKEKINNYTELTVEQAKEIVQKLKGEKGINLQKLENIKPEVAEVLGGFEGEYGLFLSGLKAITPEVIKAFGKGKIKSVQFKGGELNREGNNVYVEIGENKYNVDDITSAECNSLVGNIGETNDDKKENEVTTPGTKKPGTTNPGGESSGTKKPGTTNPGGENSGTTNPGTTTPGTTPVVTNPGAKTPKTTNPEGGNTTETTPKETIPEVSTEDPELRAFKEKINNYTELTVEQAKEIVQKLKGEKGINLQKLENIKPEVAEVLGGFEGEYGLFLSGLKAITPEVIKVFGKGKIKSIRFKGGELNREGDNVYVEIGEKKYNVDDITSAECDSLVGNTGETNDDKKENEVTTPGTKKPGTTNPGGESSGTKKPGTTNPGGENSGTTNPGTTTPGTTPVVTNPGAKTPGTTNPGGEVPTETTPGTTNPGGENTTETTPEESTENPELRAFKEKINNYTELTVEQAKEIVEKLKGEKGINLQKLESMKPEVAEVLAGFEGEYGLFLGGLKTITPEVVKVFGKGKIKSIKFKGGELNREGDNVYVQIGEEKKNINSITTDDCNLLIQKGNDQPGEGNGTQEGGETQGGSETESVKKDNEQKNKYGHSTTENIEQVETPEAIASNYDALIAYMEGKDNNNLVQAFQRLRISPNSIANALSQILKDNPDVNKGSFTTDHISDEARNQLGRNAKWFVNERKELVKILNNVEKDKLQQFINEMKVFNDVRELQKVKNYVKQNANRIVDDPFRYLSDFGRNGRVDAGAEGLRHNGRTSEQAIYDVFVSLGETKEEGNKKKIIDGEKTADLVQGFVSMIKSVGDGRYDNIEADFSGGYTMENLGKYMAAHPETIVLYQQIINTLSYNPSVDISNIVSHSKRQAIVDSEMKKIDSMSTNRDEVQKRFNAQMENDPKLKEWFESLSDKEKKNWIGNVDAFLGEWGLLRVIVNTLGVYTNTGVTLDSLESVTTEWHRFQDDAGVGPRVSFIVPNIQGRLLNIDVPIVNFTANCDLNHSDVENSVINGVNPVYQFYGRLGANMECSISRPNSKEPDSKWGAYLAAAVELALGGKVDYKKGIELSANRFGNVLQGQIFKDPDFTSKEGFKEKATKSIQDIIDSTDKDDESKYLRKFIKNNKQEMFNCVDNISNLLDTLGAFSSDKKPEHKAMLLNSIIKGIIEEVKNQNIQEMDGKTKLTRIGVFGQVGIGGGYNIDGEMSFGAGWGVGVETTISAWNMIYLPDKEKYNYMDEALKSGSSIESVSDKVKTNNIEGVKESIKLALSQNSIPGISVESNDKKQIEISISDEVLNKYEKKNIYELLNIYVNPDKSKNVAISEDGKKLTLGGNNIQDFSVATRRYFDDFAVYLMIGGKGIDGCGNNKINEETVSEYNTPGHFEQVPGFEFKSEAKKRIEKKEETNDYNIDNWFGQADDPFKQFEKSLEKLDNGKWISYVEFMEASCDLDDDIINESDYIDAFKKIQKMLNASTDKNLQNIKKYVNGISDINEKVFVVDRFKMIFSLINGTDSKKGLENLANKRGTNYETLFGYDKSAKFPLEGESYRTKLLNQIGDGKVNRVVDPNLVGMTAFYKRGHVSSKDSRLVKQQLDQAYGYSMTRIGATDYLGTLYDIEESHLAATKEWFKKNLEKTEIHRKLLEKSIGEKIKEQIGVDCEITDEQLYKLLQGEDIDISGKKVRIEIRYVFYLLGECGNESVGVQLGKLTITITHEGDNPDDDHDNPDDDHDNPEDNVLNVGVDGQTLTSTTALNQDDLNGKFNVWGGKIADNGEGAITHQESNSNTSTSQEGGGNTGQQGGGGGGNGGGGSGGGNGGGSGGGGGWGGNGEGGGGSGSGNGGGGRP